jgi:hypothetical protein
MVVEQVPICHPCIIAVLSPNKVVLDALGDAFFTQRPPPLLLTSRAHRELVDGLLVAI